MGKKEVTDESYQRFHYKVCPESSMDRMRAEFIPSTAMFTGTVLIKD